MNRRAATSRKWDGLTADQKHLILREAYRNYLSFEQYVSDTGRDIIEYSIPVSETSDEWVSITISFTDLQRALKNFEKKGTILSSRKEEAFYLNVIRDMRQKDVAEIMGITTVSVGQYVEQACRQIAELYFSEDSSALDFEKEQEVNA